MAAELTARSAGHLADASHPGAGFGWLRSALRGFGFASALALSALDYCREALFVRGCDRRLLRARWLHRWCRVYARIIGLQVANRGAFPGSGLIVSNHLSYLDIVALSSLAPCVFVAKKEVASWPVFGFFARVAGTIFVNRARRMEVAASNEEISAALRGGVVVVLFAEGTSSGGQTVLPFRSSLLEAARSSVSVVVPAAIRYEIADGSVSDEVCYWGEMTLLPHLMNLLSKRTIHAHLAFGSAENEPAARSRKDAAVQLHEEVAALHTALAAA